VYIHQPGCSQPGFYLLIINSNIMKTQKTNNEKANKQTRAQQTSKTNTKKSDTKNKPSRKYHFEHGNYC